jgi:hypothetical protein
MQNDIASFLSSIENGIITPSSHIYQLNLTTEKISKIVNELEVKAGKACGIDEILNEFLKFRSQTNAANFSIKTVV